MGQPHPVDGFEGRAPSQRADQGPKPLQPDWLTRVGDANETPAPYEANPGPALDPHPPAPRGHAHAARPHGTGMKLPGHGSAAPADPDSWEGAVELANKDAKYTVIDEATLRGPGLITRVLQGFNLGAVASALGGLAKFKPVLLVAIGVIAVVAVLMMRPRDEQTASISTIRKHPERFEGRPVKIKGRVGEVFVVGGGYAFHLHQGREDIVVFTRSRVPVRREELTVTGNISNGTLDGKTRQALFENPEQ